MLSAFCSPVCFPVIYLLFTCNLTFVTSHSPIFPLSPTCLPNNYLLFTCHLPVVYILFACLSAGGRDRRSELRKDERPGDDCAGTNISQVGLFVDWVCLVTCVQYRLLGIRLLHHSSTISVPYQSPSFPIITHQLIVSVPYLSVISLIYLTR